MLRRYGLTIAEWDELLKAQGGRCAICRTDRAGGGDDRWHVDHDHATGQIRGLLCNSCNQAIGLLKDDPEIIAAAARYVARGK